MVIFGDEMYESVQVVRVKSLGLVRISVKNLRDVRIFVVSRDLVVRGART